MSVESMTVDLSTWRTHPDRTAELIIVLGLKPTTQKRLTVRFPSNIELGDIPRHVDLQLGLRQILMGIPESQFRVMNCRLLETEPYRLCITLYVQGPVHLQFNTCALNTT